MCMSSRTGKKLPRPCLIEKIIAQLDGTCIASTCEEYGNTFIELRNQRLVGIDIDRFYGKRIFAAEGLQRLKHVIAQVAIGSGI